MKRRRALRILGAAAAAPALLPASGDELLAFAREVRRGLRPGEPRELSALTPLQARTVTAVGEVIIPETETPGATTAGVVDFVDVIAAEWFDDAERDRLLTGVDEIDGRARAREDEEFAGCSLEGRIALVAELDAEVDELRRASSEAAGAHFFYDLKRLVLAGYFTSEPGMRAMGYRVVPGAWEACVLLDEYGSGAGR